jgi:23S rRNA-/tRNA-specific pseudouridylate synthase
MTKAELITIEEDQPEQRIDRWLRRRCPELAQGRIEKMCRKGEIRVDGKRVKASTRKWFGSLRAYLTYSRRGYGLHLSNRLHLISSMSFDPGSFSKTKT